MKGNPLYAIFDKVAGKFEKLILGSWNAVLTGVIEVTEFIYVNKNFLRPSNMAEIQNGGLKKKICHFLV